jgi:hypothetical protein
LRSRVMMTGHYWQFCFHFSYQIHSSVENPAPPNCRFAVEPTWGFGKVKASSVERLQCSSCATLGRCLVWQLALGFSLHHQLCRRSSPALHLYYLTSLRPRTLRQRLLARTSCQERIINKASASASASASAFHRPRLLVAYFIITSQAHQRHPLSHPLIVSASADQRRLLYVKPVSLTTLPVPHPRFYPAITVFYHAFAAAPRKFADPSPQHTQTSLSDRTSTQAFLHVARNVAFPIAILGPRVSIPRPHSSLETVPTRQTYRLSTISTDHPHIKTFANFSDHNF